MGATLSRDGTRIGWREAGSGPPIVLVHGAPADHTRWETFAPSLLDRFRLCLVDRRGRGLSDDGAAYSIASEYDDIAAVAEALGGGVTVLGHSYGGTVALGAATRSTAIARVACYEGWPGVRRGPVWYDDVPDDVPDGIQTLLDAGDADGAVAYLMREVVGLTDDDIARMRTQPAWAGRLAGVRLVSRELRAERSATLSESALRSIAAPVLFVIGEENDERLRPEVEELQAILKDARITVLPGQGHIAMDTAPEALAHAIVAFVEATG
jgi:pimeloyl-ACP methyl ester carboxylesterase